MSRFATDTAVTAVGGGCYSARIDEGWWIQRGPNGGYLAAIVLRAILAEVSDPERTPRSITLHYLRPPAVGPCEVAVTVERAGRGLTTVTARLSQGDKDCILALAALGVARPGATFDDHPAPVMPSPRGARAPVRRASSRPVPGPLRHPSRPGLGPLRARRRGPHGRLDPHARR